MLGTIINTSAIIAGGLAGTFIKNRLTDKYKDIIMQAIGISVVFVGIASSISKMILPEANPILFIISLVIGGIIGEAIGLERKINRFGAYLQNKVANSDNSFSKSFVHASILFCVGSMSILGAIQSGTQNDHQLLYIKSILDGVASVIIAASSGIGVVFAAVSVFVYQGSLTLLSGFFEPYFTEDMSREISIVGGVLIAAIGLDILEIKKIKIANLLPSVFIPVIYYIILKSF